LLANLRRNTVWLQSISTKILYTKFDEYYTQKENIKKEYVNLSGYVVFKTDIIFQYRDEA